MAAVNLGRERPTPPHVNRDTPDVQRLLATPGSYAGSYQVSPYGLSVTTGPAVYQPAKKKAPTSKSSFNHR